MELLKANFLNTTTMITVNSATATAEHLMNPDTTFQYVSEDFDNDLTTVSLTIGFDQTTSVSRLAILGHNLKDFTIFYNGATANTLALLNGPTSASSWTGNSETAQYLTFTPIDCTSITLDLKKTMVADSEKAIGYLVISEERSTFSRIPSARGYRPLYDAQEVQHRLSTGDIRIQTLTNKWNFEVSLNYIDTDFRDELKEIYDLHTSHIFVPFGTATSWDKIIAPVVWPAPFDFYRHSDNAPSAGFEGTIRLFETTP